MIRILHIVSSLNISSGVMAVLMNYHRNIVKYGIQFDYLSFKKTDDSYEKEINNLGGKVFYCEGYDNRWLFWKKINNTLKKIDYKYQIIHCHPIYTSSIIAKEAKKMGVSHIIQHSHTTKYSDNKFSAIRNMIILSLNKTSASHFMACSNDAKKIFYWEKPETIYLMKNGIEIKRFLYSFSNRIKIREKYSMNDVTVIGHIGRFTNSKNHVFLVKVFHEYLKYDKDAYLLLVGEGEKRAFIEELVKKMNMENHVIFAGNQQNIEKYYSAMDIFLFPSIFEGLGNVLVEAQMSYLPCLISNNIPKEAIFNDNVVKLSLGCSCQVWARKLKEIKEKNYKRKSCYNADYDIQECSLQLSEYYKELIKK
ncbi:MAG: glycosyltransferase [Traorella sp.]